MREIKFRFYDKEAKEMQYLSLHDLCEDDIWFDGETDMWSVLYDSHKEQERFVVMQYVGLKDKNGKEIYEGDIVKGTRPCVYETGKIIFKNGCFFVKVKETLLALWECKTNNYELKVIGNIWENGDLLNDSK